MLSLALALLAVAEAAPPSIPFEKYHLPNGLTIILSEDHRAPVVGVDVWYHVGAVNEQKGHSGFAHLFEHLMFQGSKHLHGDERTVFATLERNGASNLNGTTEWDRTNYFETMPAERLELALWLESDRMGFLLDTVDQKKLDTQREVVRNEKRQSIENVPYGRAEERLCQLLYPEPNPYFGYVIGSHQDLQQASLEDVRGFFKTYYAPNNASIAVVGDFETAKVKPLIEKYFGPIPRGPQKPAVQAKTEPHTKEVREVLHDQVQLAKVIVGYVGPPPLEGNAINAAMRILGAGKSSRLYHDLVYEQKIAQDVSATWDNGMMLGGQIELSATVQAGHTAEEVEKALLAEVAKLRAAPPAAAELERARRAVQAHLYRSLENVGGFGGKADELNYYELRANDPGYFSKDLQGFLAVTPEAVQQAVNRYMGDDQRVVLHVLPEAAKEAAK
jgi:zinc protease